MNSRKLTVTGGVALIAAMALSTIVLAQEPAAPAAAAPTPAATVSGEQTFNGRCKFCHDPASGGAPDKAELAMHSRPDIVAALTTGAMVGMARGLSAEEIDAIAVFLTTPAATDAPAVPAPATPPAA